MIKTSDRRWEYKVFGWNGGMCTNDDRNLQNILNEYGSEGWELVNIIPQVSGDSEDVRTEFNIFVYKREK